MTPLLTRQDLCNTLGISQSTLDRKIKQGLIPPPDLYLGYRCPRWKRETIEKLLKTEPVGFC